MNFQELVTEVLSITKRPDLQSRIEGAVRAATLKAHNQDFFYKDIRESGIAFEFAGHIQSFQPAQNFDNFRKVKYVRYWHFDPADIPAFGRAGKFLTAIDIENSIDGYGYIKEDVFYMAGDLIQIRTCTALTHCLVGAYTLPNITPDGFNSWIADEFPTAIYYEAARQICMQIGKNQDATNLRTAVAEEYAQLKLNSVNKPGE